MPSLKGRRLTVYDIVTKLYFEPTILNAIDDYEINLADANDALEYCLHLQCKNEQGRLHYCDGCILRTIEEGVSFNESSYLEVELDGEILTVSIDGSGFFAGTLKELEDSEFGRVTWLIAEEVKNKIGHNTD